MYTTHWFSKHQAAIRNKTKQNKTHTPQIALNSIILARLSELIFAVSFKIMAPFFILCESVKKRTLPYLVKCQLVTFGLFLL